MSAEFLLKVADVLEKSAALHDLHESDQQAAIEKVRQSALKDLSEKFAAATGEELPEDVLNKLASVDENILNTVHKLMEKKASEEPEKLGGSSDSPSAVRQPTSREERKQAAFDRFGQFLTES